MQVMVFGAAGKIGFALVSRLCDSGHVVTAFVRPTSNRATLDELNIPCVTGDALDRESVNAAFGGQQFDAVICSVGSLPGQAPTDFETNRNIIDASVAAGIRRFLLVSSIGAGDSWAVAPEAAKAYLGEIMRLRTQIEDYLAATPLDYTIIRPGGLKDDPASGTAVMTEDQTVAGLVNRADVALHLVDCLTEDVTIGKTYHLVDAERIYGKS